MNGRLTRAGRDNRLQRFLIEPETKIRRPLYLQGVNVDAHLIADSRAAASEDL